MQLLNDSSIIEDTSFQLEGEQNNLIRRISEKRIVKNLVTVFEHEEDELMSACLIDSARAR